jgi:Uma2 family endonuclease
MALSVIFEEQVEVPLELRSLDDFRRWAQSEGFPEKGRIDYINGRIEIDMSPEDIFCHETLKSEIAGAVYQEVKRSKLGILLIDSGRVTCPKADLSTEPDIVFLSHDSLNAGRARLVPKASGEPGRYVEIEGPPDLVVEVVSDTSVAKDTKRLPAAYFAAGVREFWLADARGPEPVFRIHRLGKQGYEPVERDAEGFQASAVLGCRFRLDAARDRRGHWEFDLRRRDD